MKNSSCKYCSVKLNYFDSVGFCFECSTYSLYNSGWNRPDNKANKQEWIYSIKPNNSKTLNGKYVEEIHPLELYQNMISDADLQSPYIYIPEFSLKEERTKEICEIMRFSSVFKMDSMVMHMAIRYFDMILQKMETTGFNLRSSKCGNIDIEDVDSNYNPFRSSTTYETESRTVQRLSTLRNSKLDLASATCALIASKIHEIDDNLIRIYEIEKEMKYKYTFKNITNCEQKIYEELNWNLFIQTPYHYANLFISAGVLFTDDIIKESAHIHIKHSKDNAVSIEEANTISKIYDEIRKSVESILLDAAQDYEFLQYNDRVVGLGCICVARKVNKIIPYFSSHFPKIYGISYEEVKEVIEKLIKCNIKIPSIKRTSSWKCIPDTPSRIKDIEYVACEISDEQTYREKKLFPKNNNEKDKTSCNSPLYDLPKDQFSDYFTSNNQDSIINEGQDVSNNLKGESTYNDFNKSTK